MTYSPNTLIIGRGGSIDDAIDRVGTSNAAYTRELFRLCQATGITFAIAFAQFCHETADGTSPRWMRNRNPAGLGIESDSDADPATLTQEEAARVHVWALEVATGRFSDVDDIDYELPGSAVPFISRWMAKYADPNCPAVVTVADLQRRYVDATSEPQATWGWDAAYAEKLVAKANDIFKETPMPDTIVFNAVPDPGIVQMICAKPYDGAGFTRVAPRKPVGVCEHITAGYGSAQWYSNFFATGGERQYDALVDFVVDRKGTIGMLNDPWGTRSPWANGRTDGLEGDGPAFLAKFGINGVNDRLISIEHEGQPADVWPKAQWEASVKLTAYLYDRMGVRWDAFPVHQDYGVVTHMLHSEFTGKGGNAADECPGRFFKSKINQFQSEVRALLKFHQTGSVIPVDPKPKPEPVSIYPAGMDLGIAKTLFGKIRKHVPGKTVTEHGFDPAGGVSLAWLQRGAAEGQFPQGGDWYQYEGERELIVFENGWALWRPSKRAGWRWIGEAAQTKAA